MISVEVREINSAIRKLKRFEKGLPRAINNGARKVTKKIEKRAKRNVAERSFWENTGRLEKSIRARPLRRRGRVIKWAVGPDLRVARYAEVVERGQHISGWHAVLSMKGNWYMAPGGRFRARPMWFMRDAFRGVRALKETKEEINKLMIKTFRCMDEIE